MALFRGKPPCAGLRLGWSSACRNGALCSSVCPPHLHGACNPLWCVLWQAYCDGDVATHNAEQFAAGLPALSNSNSLPSSASPGPGNMSQVCECSRVQNIQPRARQRHISCATSWGWATVSGCYAGQSHYGRKGNWGYWEILFLPISSHSLTSITLKCQQHLKQWQAKGPLNSFVQSVSSWCNLGNARIHCLYSLLILSSVHCYLAWWMWQEDSHPVAWPQETIPTLLLGSKLGREVETSFLVPSCRVSGFGRDGVYHLGTELVIVALAAQCQSNLLLRVSWGLSP